MKRRTRWRGAAPPSVPAAGRRKRLFDVTLAGLALLRPCPMILIAPVWPDLGRARALPAATARAYGPLSRYQFARWPWMAEGGGTTVWASMDMPAALPSEFLRRFGLAIAPVWNVLRVDMPSSARGAERPEFRARVRRLWAGYNTGCGACRADGARASGGVAWCLAHRRAPLVDLRYVAGGPCSEISSPRADRPRDTLPASRASRRGAVLHPACRRDADAKPRRRVEPVGKRLSSTAHAVGKGSYSPPGSRNSRACSHGLRRGLGLSRPPGLELRIPSRPGLGNPRALVPVSGLGTLLLVPVRLGTFGFSGLRAHAHVFVPTGATLNLLWPLRGGRSGEGPAGGGGSGSTRRVNAVRAGRC